MEFPFPSSTTSTRAAKKTALPSVNIRAFKSPPGFFSPFFPLLKLSPHEQTGFHLQMDTRPLAGRGVAPYRTLLHNAPRCRANRSGPASSLCCASLMSPRLCSRALSPHALLRTYSAGPWDLAMPVGSLLLLPSGARPVGFDVAFGCRRQRSDDGHITLWAQSLFGDAC